MKHLLSISITFLLVASCTAQWGKKIKGNGNTIERERSVGEYDEIALSGWFDVEIVDGTEGTLTLEGEENLLEYIVTEVKNGKLVIKQQKGHNIQPSRWQDGIRITVPVERISSVTLSGSGDILSKKRLEADTFSTTMSGSGDIILEVDSKRMRASMSGSGDITLSGVTDNFEANVSESGDIKAYDLKAKTVDASISGSADIKVTATETIKARVSGSGDIRYRGNPAKIDTKSSGSGDITKD